MGQDFSSVIAESVITLTRNLDGVVYPRLLDDEKGEMVTKKIIDAASKTGTYKIYQMNMLPRVDAFVMAEKGVVSQKLASSNYGAVLLAGDSNLSIVVNDTDHIVIKCKSNGLSLDKAYKTASDVDDGVLPKLPIAFDEDIGFLNSSLSRVGTGLKAEVKLFLPALAMMGNIEEIASDFNREGITVEGLAGSKLETVGYNYVLYNTKSLGKSEREIIQEVMMYASSLADAELRARDTLYKTNKEKIIDCIMRAWGVLTNAYLLSYNEMVENIALVKLGIYYNVIRLKDYMILQKLEDMLGTYSIEKSIGMELDQLSENKTRAEKVVGLLKPIRIK